MRQIPDGRDAYVARTLDPVKRERLRRIMDYGLAAPDAMDAARRYDTFVGAMDGALALSDYLAGNSFTLADAAAIPYINRADMRSSSIVVGHVAARVRKDVNTTEFAGLAEVLAKLLLQLVSYTLDNAARIAE
jgi:glutathione S-transferase